MNCFKPPKGHLFLKSKAILKKHLDRTFSELVVVLQIPTRGSQIPIFENLVYEMSNGLNSHSSSCRKKDKLPGTSTPNY